MVKLDILQIQKFGSISNQHIHNFCMREDMSTLDYVMIVSTHLESMEDNILYGQ